MALELLTKITSVGISGGLDITGIVTATSFDGDISGNITGTAATFTGPVTVGGVLTYEDVSNIDSVGLITARKGIDVSGGATINQANVTGVSSYAGLVDVNNRIDVVGGANIDQLNLTGVSTFAGAIDANGNLDVDGQTDLDVLNVAETATFSALVDVNNRIDVVGGANIDQLNVTGVSTFAGFVGINEASPNRQLHVHDDTQYKGIFINGSDVPRIAFARNTTTTGEWSVGIDGTNGNQFAINNSDGNSNRKLIISSSQITLYSNTYVAGNMQFTSANAQIELNNGGPRFWSPSANTLTIHTGGGFGSATNERLRITSAGKVGIGTNSPEAILEVFNATSKVGALTVRTGAGSGGYAGLAFASNAAAGREKAAIYFQETTGGAHHAGDLVIAVDSNGGDAGQVATSDEKVRIKSTGKVGIGTNNPDQTLEIHTLSGTNLFKASTKANSTVGLEIEKTGSTTQTWRIVDGQSVNGRLEIYDVTDSRSVMTFDGSGKVGINEISPDAPLHITGGLPHIRLENSGTSASAGDILGQIDFKHNDSDDAGVTAAIKCTAEDNAGNSYLTFHNGDGGNADERVRITSAGNMGLGNDASFPIFSESTDRTLIVGSGSNDAAIQLHSATDKYGGIYFGDSTSGGARYRGYVEYYHNSDYLTFATAGDPRLRITSDEKFGFGLTTPQTTIHVSQVDAGFWLGNPLGDSYQSGQNPTLKLYSDCSEKKAFIDVIWGGDNNYDRNITFGGSYLALHSAGASNGAETVRVANDAVGINTTDSVFGQSTPISTHSPKLGVQGSILIGSLSTGTTSRNQLQFYRRNGTNTGSPISSHMMGDIAWYGSSNDGNNSNLAWSIGVTATGGDWTSGGNRTGRMLFSNHDGEMARFSESGVFCGRDLVNRSSGSGNWTTSGSWKVIVDLNGWPADALYICDSAMQHSGAYTATFWVYKTNNAQYKVIHDQDSLLHWRINGSQLELQQNSGADQTNTFGYQKIFMALGMHIPAT